MPRKNRFNYNKRFVIPPNSRIVPQEVKQDTLSICSFNLLADCIHTAGIRKTGAPLDTYDAWQHRWPVLLEQLLLLTGDILCLQEVDKVRQAPCYGDGCTK